MSFARLVLKDLRVEARGREALVAMALVALTTVTIGLLAFHHEADEAGAASGILWISLSFAAALGLGRALGAEKDRGTLATLLTLPVERGTLYLAKTASTFLLLLVVALVVAPAYLLARAAPVPDAWPGLLLVFALGALGLAATGTVLSALAAHARGRDLLLPVLLFPLLVPLLLSAVHATDDLLHGAPFREWRPELLVLAGYDVAFLAASTLLFEHAVED